MSPHPAGRTAHLDASANRSHGGDVVSPLLRPDDVARRLGVKRRTLYAWTDQGRISGYKLGRLLRFSESDVAAFLERAARTDDN
jgi:excisionase family DNA binding protein